MGLSCVPLSINKNYFSILNERPPTRSLAFTNYKLMFTFKIPMKTIFSLAFILVVGFLFAQPAPPGDGGAPVPLDGGLLIVLAAGAVYGVKKVKGVE